MMAEFVRTETRTSRKQRRCDGCCAAIEVGERYFYMAWKDEGYFCSAAYHPDCRQAEVDLNAEAGLRDDEWTWLHDLVAEGGAEVMLVDQPETVRARFGLAVKDHPHG